MAQKSIKQLKLLFRRGNYPTEADFASLLDSYFHKADDIIPIGNIDTLAERLNNKLDTDDAARMTARIDTIVSKYANVDDRLSAIYTDLDVDAIAAKVADVDDRLESLAQMQQLAQQAAQLMPLKLNVSYPSRITFGNPVAQKVIAQLLPTYQIPNVLFLGDGNAVDIQPDGSMEVLKTGRSRIHVIPTTNTALYQTINIEVVEPSITLAAADSFLLVGDSILFT